MTSELGGSIELHGDDGTRVPPHAIPLARRSIEPPTSDGSGLRGGVQAGVEALLGEPRLAQLAALLFGGAAPDAGLLVGGERELEALLA